MKSPYEFLCAMLLRNELEKKGAFSNHIRAIVILSLSFLVVACKGLYNWMAYS